MKIQLSRGLEARPVAVLVQVASQFDASIYIESESKNVNAKSIMGMMSLNLNTGESILVAADGTDEQAAIDKIEAYLNGEETE